MMGPPAGAAFEVKKRVNGLKEGVGDIAIDLETGLRSAYFDLKHGSNGVDGKPSGDGMKPAVIYISPENTLFLPDGTEVMLLLKDEDGGQPDGLGLGGKDMYVVRPDGNGSTVYVMDQKTKENILPQIEANMKAALEENRIGKERIAELENTIDGISESYQELEAEIEQEKQDFQSEKEVITAQLAEKKAEVDSMRGELEEAVSLKVETGAMKQLLEDKAAEITSLESQLEGAERKHELGMRNKEKEKEALVNIYKDKIAELREQTESKEVEAALLDMSLDGMAVDFEAALEMASKSMEELENMEKELYKSDKFLTDSLDAGEKWKQAYEEMAEKNKRLMRMLAEESVKHIREARLSKTSKAEDLAPELKRISKIGQTEQGEASSSQQSDSSSSGTP